jgi:drug/metabolite transporter (DMT)-like permease
MAALLYSGAGLGMLVLTAVQGKRRQEARITVTELPYTIAMVVLDIGAPIFLMTGLTMSSAAAVSLLSNFEIVATALIALLIFKEAVGKRTWIAIVCICVASIILSIENLDTHSLSALTVRPGSLWVLLACICWGLENNCTSKLSLKDPLQIVMIKGIGSGLGSLLVALWLGQYTIQLMDMGIALLLGFVSYGLSIYWYIYAQRQLGAARTSAYYALAPFIGAGLSGILFQEKLTGSFMGALLIMAAGVYCTAFERHTHTHRHEALDHEHRHNHQDGHHTHTHEPAVPGEHSHPHVHVPAVHAHPHRPDVHHAHIHRERMV